MKAKIVRSFNRLNLHRLKLLKKFLNKSLLAILIILLVLLFKKINLDPTNTALNVIRKNISYEFRPIRDTRNLILKTKNLIEKSAQAVKVFNPIKFDKYPPPIVGSISRDYKKDENEGVDIKSVSGEDPKSITGGKVKEVELIENKGFFITIEKENLQIVYGYLSKPYVSRGDEIDANTYLGALGTNKDGNKYLRLEMKVDGTKVNPSKYINLK